MILIFNGNTVLTQVNGCGNRFKATREWIGTTRVMNIPFYSFKISSIFVIEPSLNYIRLRHSDMEHIPHINFFQINFH